MNNSKLINYVKIKNDSNNSNEKWIDYDKNINECRFYIKCLKTNLIEKQ